MPLDPRPMMSPPVICEYSLASMSIVYSHHFCVLFLHSSLALLIGASWFLLVPHGVYWCLLVCLLVCVLVFTGMFIGVYWCLLVFVCVAWGVP